MRRAPRRAVFSAVLVLAALGCRQAPSTDAEGDANASPEPTSGADARAALGTSAGTSPADPAEAGAAPSSPAPWPVALVQPVADRLGHFGVTLFDHVRSDSQDIVLSPASIGIALAMATVGARTETRSQILRVLGFGPSEEVWPGFSALVSALNGIDGRRGLVLKVADGLWYASGASLEPGFASALTEGFGAPPVAVDFSASEDARRAINAWVSQRTGGMIDGILQSNALRPDTRLVLVNTIYLHANWLAPFDPRATQTQPFATPAGPVPVPMMHRTADMRFAAARGVKVVELEYDGGRVAMDLILPDDPRGLRAVEKHLAEHLQSWLAPLRSERVDLVVPRWKQSWEGSLRQPLATMGMPVAFSNVADFSGIATERWHIDDVFHRAVVEVDEQGTKAAAATAMRVYASAPMPPPLRFRADHPFVFVIRELVTGTILFLGHVVDPR